MPRVSPVIVIELVGGGILLALCAATSWLVLRRSSRARIRQLPGAHLVVAAVVAALPWVYMLTRGGNVSIHASTGLQLVGVIVAALLTIIALLLFPLAVVMIAIAWLLYHRSPSTSS